MSISSTTLNKSGSDTLPRSTSNWVVFDSPVTAQNTNEERKKKYYVIGNDKYLSFNTAKSGVSQPDASFSAKKVQNGEVVLRIFQ